MTLKNDNILKISIKHNKKAVIILIFLLYILLNILDHIFSQTIHKEFHSKIHSSSTLSPLFNSKPSTVPINYFQIRTPHALSSNKMQLTIAAKQIARQYRSHRIYSFSLLISSKFLLRDCFLFKLVAKSVFRVLR